MGCPWMASGDWRCNRGVGGELGVGPGRTRLTVSGQALLAYGKPHLPSNLRWAGLRSIRAVGGIQVGGVRWLIVTYGPCAGGCLEGMMGLHPIL